MPITGALGGLLLLLLTGFGDIKFTLAPEYIWTFMLILIPSSAAYGIITKMRSKT